MQSRRVSYVVLLIGLGLLVVGATLLLTDRPVDWWVWAAGVLLVAFGLFDSRLRTMKVGPGGVEVAIGIAATPIEQLASPTQPPDVKLTISSGIPMGAARVAMQSDYIIQVTVVNTSDKPIGVNSIGLRLSGGKWISVYLTTPTEGNIKLPAVLQPQQSATTWLDYKSTRERLAEDGLTIEEIVANLADGTTRSEPIPESWRTLRDE